jgi:hypothetical protein
MSAIIGIIFVIFFYNSSLSSPEAADAICSGMDKFGVKEIYPTKSGGELMVTICFLIWET